MKIQNSSIRIGITGFLSIFAFTSVYPLFWLFINSFKDTSEIMTGNSFGLPSYWKVANYIDALFQRDILKYFTNSVLTTAGTIILTLVVSIMLGYGLTRMKWRQSEKVSRSLALGLMLPNQIVIVPIFIMLKNMRLINNPIALILTISAFNICLATIIVSSFMKSIPYEMEEASVIDGANLFTILTKIIVPMLQPAIAAMSINIFINSWNEFIYALVVITGTTWRTLPVALMNYASGKFGTDYGGMFAAMIITSALPVLLFLSFSNEVEKSMSAGALLK
ncbi:MAG: carbohydrate ABC transporter permease [Clostridia bacterium]|jgi:raffinose/stachyose/melibiose transport system permease protein|nr:carbohydrate ABC transporter permease [Clostridia bacterium]